ncbi:uncharacterized protein (DUF2267 family) [Rhizobium rosettiformans]|uniref:DUF2267 domain-containing protein n=2 Tax=Rhizobium rosettiformans TaxID=1368430 RepID=A0A4S8Q0Q1_9HYPH|nr:DUF2267 domain-containing protein [Rhizobium rosettiformans]MBB5276425.1 uncharacterized protein (DUF2267 family) [Rhizobium rosettiformans]THV35962.1 DUF2267 domain-containing protein [Rhizobium rosettiformans W3]
MPMPLEYCQASADFDAFMKDLVATSMIQTSHQAYTMLLAVLQVFRHRLTVAQAIAFANVLPPVLRAIFVSDWDVEAPVKPFVDRDALMKEVRAFRHDHNLSTDTALEDVTVVLRRHVDQAAFERALSQLPQEARGFWLIGQA